MINIVKHTLQNGLRIVVHHDSTTPLAAVNLLYDVGARDEDPTKTGLAHLLEHLMFSGSKNIPSYDTPLQRVGGENNAWTSNDFTNYYVTLPSNNIETAFWLESDRMMGLNFTEKSLAIQKKVVAEEFKQRYLNQPYGDIPLLTRPLAFKVHPYQWPTIGKEITHIENVSLEEVESFFYKYYAPNNAVLSVAGNVDPEIVFGLAEKWFGAIPKREVPERSLPQEKRRVAQEVLEVVRNVPAPLVHLNFHIGKRTDADYHTNDLLSDVLSSGPSSRLTQTLMKEQQIFSNINAYISGYLDPGLFTVTGRMMPGVSMRKAEDAIWNQLHKIAKEGVKSKELQKVKNKIESDLVFAEISFLNKAMNMALYEMFGDAEKINEEVNHYRNVKMEDIQNEAQTIFQENNSTVMRYATTHTR